MNTNFNVYDFICDYIESIILYLKSNLINKTFKGKFIFNSPFITIIVLTLIEK